MRRPTLAFLLACLLLPAAPDAAAAKDDLPPVQAVAVGDFDGDGIPDVAAGLPDLTVGKFKAAGEVRLYSGKTGALLRRFPGREKDENYSDALAAVGDADGDGATDLAIGSAFAETGAGVDVLSSKTGKRLFHYPAGELSSLGDALCPLGDGSGKESVMFLMRDGMRKYWIPAYANREAVQGSIADPSGFSGFGSPVGDMDGDGRPEVALTDSMAEAKGKKGAGRVRVLSGKAVSGGGGPVDLLVLEGSQAGEMLGVIVGPAGDWDGDKKGDLLVGSKTGTTDRNSAWVLRVLSGKDQSELWKAAGQPGDFSIGGAVVLGDVDGDGKPDVAVGNPMRGAKAGSVSALSGKDGAVLWTVAGVKPEFLGEEVLPARDADGDGFADLVVVARGSALDGKKGKGYIRILSGKTGKLVSAINPLEAK